MGFTGSTGGRAGAPSCFCWARAYATVQTPGAPWIAKGHQPQEQSLENRKVLFTAYWGFIRCDFLWRKQGCHKHLSLVTAGEISLQIPSLPTCDHEQDFPWHPGGIRWLLPTLGMTDWFRRRKGFQSQIIHQEKEWAFFPSWGPTQPTYNANKMILSPFSPVRVPTHCHHQLIPNFRITSVLPGTYFYRHKNLHFQVLEF